MFQLDEIKVRGIIRPWDALSETGICVISTESLPYLLLKVNYGSFKLNIDPS